MRQEGKVSSILYN